MKDVSKQSRLLKIFLCSVFSFCHGGLCLRVRPSGGRLFDLFLILVVFWFFLLLSHFCSFIKWGCIIFCTLKRFFINFSNIVSLRGNLIRSWFWWLLRSRSFVLGLGSMQILLLRQLEKELLWYLPSALTRRYCSSVGWIHRAAWSLACCQQPLHIVLTNEQTFSSSRFILVKLAWSRCTACYWISRHMTTTLSCLTLLYSF